MQLEVYEFRPIDISPECRFESGDKFDFLIVCYDLFLCKNERALYNIRYEKSFKHKFDTHQMHESAFVS